MPKSTRWQDELILRPIAAEVIESYRSVLGKDQQVLLAVAILRESSPHLLSPHLLQQLMEAEGHASTQRKLEDLDKRLWAEVLEQLEQDDDRLNGGPG